MRYWPMISPSMMGRGDYSVRILARRLVVFSNLAPVSGGHTLSMPSRKTAIGFETVRALGLAMPGVEAGTTFDSPALKIHKRMFACLATHKSAEPHTLVASVGFDRRDELIAADPDIYYLKDHYANYPVVLVRLARVHPDALRGILATAKRFEESRAKKRKRRLRS